MNTHSARIRREFLGWDTPALPEAARRLAARYRQGHVLDLSRVIVVVPGQRAGRRLRELLAYHAEDEKLLLTPPDVVTEGKLPEKLYTAKFPFASDVVQDLAWAQALRDLPAQERRLVVPQPPNQTDSLRWLELGRVVRRLHTEMAADGLDFSAVLRHGPKLENFNEAARWLALAELQRRYLALLDRQQLWDIQTARLKAIEFREPRTECDIILLGAVDLNNTLRQMLDQVADRVTAYVVAPEAMADRFDHYGCLIPDAWCAAHVPLHDDQLRHVDGPQEQAEAVTDWLAELRGRYGKDEIVIGAPDESLVPQLQRQLEQCQEQDPEGKQEARGLKARWVEGVRIRETAPHRLLAAATEFAGQHRFEAVAALIRHPDVEDWLRNRGIGLRSCPPAAEERSPAPRTHSLPAQLDRFYNEHLPNKLRSNQIAVNEREWPDLAAALHAVEQWLAPAAAELPLRSWGDVFRQLLGVIYGDRQLILDKPDDNTLHKTLEKMLDVCDRLTEAPAPLDTAPISAADAFRIVMKPLGAEYLPPPADPDALEILGWLELPLDDAPALIVTSFNEGFVPQSSGADAFLPDKLRRKLNVLHNERRYARDAYAAHVLCHSRPELRVVLARRDARADPLHPSRLLFACPDETMVPRCRRFFDDQMPPAGPRRLLLAPADTSKIPDESHFEVPRPAGCDEKLEKISVTRFKTYLACPYRYYLRHVRKIKAIDDAARELDGGAFGTLIHRVLSAFGKDARGPRHSDRPARIVEYLEAALIAGAGQVLDGSQRRPAIRLQLEQARQRLHAFALRQAALVREGWRIVYAEQEPENNGDNARSNLEIPFPAENSSVNLTGRIDRIDFHEATRTIRILDYKTADSAAVPEKTHRDRRGWTVAGAGELTRLAAEAAERDHKGWIDLQLPLYAQLCRDRRLPLPEHDAVQLGYFNLPKRLDEIDIALAEWNEDDLRDANSVAAAVIRRIAAGLYWPPVYDPVPLYQEDLAAICLDNAFGAPALGDEENGGGV